MVGAVERQRRCSYQPRATPWVYRVAGQALKGRLTGASDNVDAGLQPAICQTDEPRALPWADMTQAFGLIFSREAPNPGFQNLVNLSNSFTRRAISGFLIRVVRTSPKPSQQKEATTLP